MQKASDSSLVYIGKSFRPSQTSLFIGFYTPSGELHWSGSHGAYDAVFDGASSVCLDVTLSAHYEAAPTVDEQYAMVVNPGLTYEDEQSFIDAVMNGVVAGTLAPAYTIESTTAGDVINPDVGTDTEDQANILSWLMISFRVIRSVRVSRQGFVPEGPTIRSISQCPSSLRCPMISGRISMLGNVA